MDRAQKEPGGREKRRRTRVDVSFEAELVFGDHRETVLTENISLKGLLCRTSHPMAKGDTCRVRLVLAEDAVIEISGTIARAEGGEAAVDFTAMDEDSFSHLRRLVQLHFGDAEAIDREMLNPAFENSGDEASDQG